MKGEQHRPRAKTHRRSVRAIVLAAGLVLLSPAAFSDIYKYRDPNGRIYLTDQPMPSSFRLLKVFRGMGGSTRRSPAPSLDAQAPWAERLRAKRQKYAPIIEAAARRLELQPELLHAVILAESAYDPSAVSSAGAVGLMQLMPKTAERYGVSDRLDPKSNVDGGATYLRDLLELFEDNLTLAVAAYNAGENAVQQYGNRIPPYPETQQYVRKVLTLYRRGIFGGS